MTGWAYKVPRYWQSRWDNGRGSVISYEPSQPRVGVYCDGRPLRDGGMSHSDDLWLVGSLAISAEVIEQLEKVFWGWAAEYPTGDGILIDLDWHQTHDNRPRRPTRAATQTLEGEQVLPSHSAVVAADQSHVRLNYVMACKLCGQSYKWRSDTIQQHALKLWVAGIREISLWSLSRICG